VGHVSAEPGAAPAHAPAMGRRAARQERRRRAARRTRRRLAVALAVLLFLGALSLGEQRRSPRAEAALPSNSPGELSGTTPSSWADVHRNARPADSVPAGVTVRFPADVAPPAGQAPVSTVPAPTAVTPSPAPGDAGPTAAPTSSRPEPAPSPQPAPETTGCAALPSRCGYPDATTTGVEPGVRLRKVPQDVRQGPGWTWDPRGLVVVSGPGTVFEGYEVAGTVDVRAAAVTVRNVRIREDGESFGVALRHAKDATVANCEIFGRNARGDRLMVGIKDIYADSTGTRVLRNDIWHTATGIQLQSGLVQDNYVHGLGLRDGDHVNGFTDNGGVTQPLVIRHNTFLNPHPQTDAISLFQDFGEVANRTIEGNLVAGGSYTIYAGQGHHRTWNIRVTNNRFARLYFPLGGRYGPVTAFEGSGPGNVFRGNVWDDTGEPVGR
jgi:hypothetical protein